MDLLRHRVALVLLTLYVVGALFLSVSKTITGGSGGSQTLLSAIAVCVLGGLLLAYWRGWDNARYYAVILMVFIASVGIPEPYVTSYGRLILAVPPAMALVLTGPAWTVGSALVEIAVLFFRAGGQDVYTSVETLVIMAMFIGSLVLSRTVTDSALRLVETSEMRYRLIAENAPDLISLLDLNDEQRYIYASPSYRTVLGYDPSALIGASGSSLVHPDDRAFVREQQALLITCAVAQATFRCRHLDGSWRWIETRWTSIGQPGASYVVAIGRDVTACKNLEMRLPEIQKLDDIEHLASRAAHDFNNVLTGISGYVELVQSSLPPGSPARADLEEIRRSTARAARLAEALLAFVRRLAPKGI